MVSLDQAFRTISKSNRLDQKDGESQVNTLIYSMGEEADDIVVSLGLTTEEAKQYSVVKGKFEAHFVVKRNGKRKKKKKNRKKKKERNKEKKKRKSIFARHGIPEQVRSDNGPQFDSAEFSYFAKVWGFKHSTSSPRFQQANGKVERGFRTVKNLLTKEKDPAKTLLAYRSTPLACKFSLPSC